MTSESADSLATAIQRQGLSISSDCLAALEKYCELLWKWNAKVNLTRHTDYDTFVTRDLTDTLQLMTHLDEGAKVLDVGSGGGVPGIPLAILRPDLEVSLAESVQKKAKILETIVRKLRLEMRVEAKRAEDVLKKRTYSVLTVRAVASLRKLLFWFQRVGHRFDHLLLIKGPRWIEEKAEAESAGLMTGVECDVVDEYVTAGHDHPSVVLRVTFAQRSDAEPLR